MDTSFCRVLNKIRQKNTLHFTAPNPRHVQRVGLLAFGDAATIATLQREQGKVQKSSMIVVHYPIHHLSIGPILSVLNFDYQLLHPPPIPTLA